ncbi:MAG: hypothetical protein PF542_05080 [Nanoarchaeota archaeon]|jgi:hypothetical protein|nr:hypothetical protein [Nanoarchaeota archaeon]
MRDISDLTDSDVINELVAISGHSPWMFIEQGPTTWDSVPYDRFQALTSKVYYGESEKNRMALNNIKKTMASAQYQSKIKKNPKDERHLLNLISKNSLPLSGKNEDITTQDFYNELPNYLHNNELISSISKKTKEDLVKRVKLSDESDALYLSYHAPRKTSPLSEVTFIKVPTKYAVAKVGKPNEGDALHFQQIENFEQQGDVALKGFLSSDFTTTTKGNTLTLYYNPKISQRNPEMIPSILEDYLFNEHKIEFEDAESMPTPKQLTLDFE